MQLLCVEGHKRTSTIFSGSDSYPERRAARKGNTVYVYGSGLVEDSLRSAFSQHGNIIDLSMDSPRKYDKIYRCSDQCTDSGHCLIPRRCPALCFLCSFSCAFITFEKMESADQAVAEVGSRLSLLLSLSSVPFIKRLEALVLVPCCDTHWVDSQSNLLTYS